MNKKEIGKKSKAAGLRFEKKVRKDLESKGWIVDKWTNNVEIFKADDQIPDDDGVCVWAKLVPSKPKFVFNPHTKTRQMIGNSSGFPDYIAFRPLIIKLPKKDYISKNYEVIGVESKMNGVLDKLEKEKCVWLLDNHKFSKILIASKGEKRGEIKYEEFTI